MPDLSEMDGSFGNPPENPLEDYEEQEPDNPEMTQEEQEEAVEDMTPDDESLVSFAETYRISEEDAGFSPKEIYEELKDGKDREPNETDKEILNALLMQGYYERKFEILDDHSFAFRTIGSQCSHNAMLALRELSDVENDGVMTQSLDNTMLVAQHLSKLNGNPTCKLGKFDKVEQVKARFRRASELPTPLLDAMGRRVNAFRSRVGDAMERSVANF